MQVGGAGGTPGTQGGKVEKEEDGTETRRDETVLSRG